MPGPPPLAGLKVLEFAGLAPGPFAGMLLADAGASVLRIDRASPSSPATAAPTADLLARRKASIAVDLKSARGVALVRELAARADVLIDPFRPGVLERLGLGPDDLRPQMERAGGLIYARITGFRRDGRYAHMAGHDINYLAVSGVLALLGRAGARPTPPWNILADFAGGGAALFQGILLALAARGSGPAAGGRGQVVEANMVDGSAYLASYPRFALKIPLLGGAPRGENLLDSGCPFYDTYETAERGRYVAVGALEPRFFAALLRGLGLQDKGWEARQHDRDAWPEMRAEFERVFRTRGRDAWEAVFDGTDACCTPVLGFGELEREREGRRRREGDQRPPVGLRDTPLLAVHQGAVDPAAQGQGEGVPGSGYEAAQLRPGDGGEELLGRWLGWVKGRDYDEQDGGLVLKQTSKPRL
ncbi:hypothetical protein RB595_001505 [Gaeumannomyces hyphopodioides]